MTTTNMKKLYKLQAEYNKVHERLGYLNNPSSIAAANKVLDGINSKMMTILNK